VAFFTLPGLPCLRIFSPPEICAWKRAAGAAAFYTGAVGAAEPVCIAEVGAVNAARHLHHLFTLQSFSASIELALLVYFFELSSTFFA
jgi:hypothetical protein